MNHHAVANLARIYATQARIEGMKAENTLREQLGQSPAYGEHPFNIEALQLEELARDTLEWGWQK